MKTHITIGLIAAGAIGTGALVGFTSNNPAPVYEAGEAASYTIDGGHSSVIFKIEHAGIANFYGRFDELEGTFTLEDGGSIEATIKSDSVHSGNDRRDGHLKSPDFFNVKQFSDITFTSTSLTKSSENEFVAKGDLTMVGTTKPASITITKTGEADVGRAYKLGFEAVMTVKRSEFGITYGLDQGALGDEVELTIAVEGARN